MIWGCFDASGPLAQEFKIKVLELNNNLKKNRKGKKSFHDTYIISLTYLFDGVLYLYIYIYIHRYAWAVLNVYNKKMYIYIYIYIYIYHSVFNGIELIECHL